MNKQTGKISYLSKKVAQVLAEGICSTQTNSVSRVKYAQYSTSVYTVGTSFLLGPPCSCVPQLGIKN